MGEMILLFLLDARRVGGEKGLHEVARVVTAIRSIMGISGKLSACSPCLIVASQKVTAK